MLRQAALFAALAASCATIVHANSGFATGLSDSGINEFKNAILPLINAELAAFSSLPDITVPDLDTPVGHVTLSLSNIKATGLAITSAGVSLVAPSTISASIAGLESATISMDYHWRKDHWPHVKSSGSVDIYPGDVTASLSVAMGTSAGSATVSTENTNVNFGSFKVKFHGDASWLYNILLKLLQGTLRKAIAKAVNGALTKAINNEGNKVLARIPREMHVGGGGSATNYTLGVDEFNVQGAGGAATAILGMAARAFDTANGAPCPFDTLPMPAIVTPAHYMLQAQLSPALLSCAVWTAYQNKALHGYYSKSAPGAFPLPLDTKDWVLFVPALPLKYPNDPMDVNITFKAGAQPQLTASPTGGLAVHNLSTVFQFGVLPSGSAGFLRGSDVGASTHVFSLGVTFNAGFDVSLSTQTNPTTGKAGPALKFAVTTLNIEYSVIDSSIGSISTSGLQKLTNLLLPFVKDVINAVGGIGFPLPALGGLSFADSAIVIQENALAINTNIKYTPAAV